MSTADFEKAAAWLSSNPAAAALPNDTKLQLYALYKSATIGDPDVSRPSIFYPAARAKYDAWQALKGMRPDEARQGYVTLARELGWKQGEPSGMGSKVSVMTREEVESSFTIHDAVIQNDKVKVLELMEHVNDVDEFGYTPLHLAADRGHAEIAKMLLEAHADPSAEDEDGQTALDIARTSGRDDVVALLHA